MGLFVVAFRENAVGATLEVVFQSVLHLLHPHEAVMAEKSLPTKAILISQSTHETHFVVTK